MMTSTRGSARTTGRWVAGTVVVDAVAYVAAITLDLVTWHGNDTLWSGGELPPTVIPLATVLVYGVLFARRHRPYLTWSVMWVYGMASLPVVGYGPFAGLLVAVYTVAANCRPGPSALVALGTAVPYTAYSYAAAVASRTVPGPLVVKVATIDLISLAVLAAAWGFGRVVQVLRARAQEQVERALAQERLRVARDLHDSVSNAITAMMLTASTLRSRCLPSETDRRDDLELIERIGTRSINELRRLLLLLRNVDGQAGIDVDERPPGLDEVQNLMEECRLTTGLDIRRRESGTRETLDPSIDHTVYRIVQEGLANITKYGDTSAPATLILAWGAGGLDLAIESAACPADRSLVGSLRQRPPSGLGLRGLRERVALVGGNLDVEHVEERFVLRALLPTTRDLEHGDSRIVRT